MPKPPVSGRSRTVRVLAATATATVAAAGLVAVGTTSAGAATSTLMTITKTSVHRLPALTANQVITVTGTGFDEDLISSVGIGGCTSDPTYVVSSPTTLLVKTAADCAVGTAKVITVTDTSSNTAVSNPAAAGGAMTLDFVAAPTIKKASDTVKPVVTENSAGSAFAKQVTTAVTKGGTVIRVFSGSTPFTTSTAYPLSASLGGVALTGVTMPTGGAYFTGTVGAHAADAAPVLKITNNGVTKSFGYGAGGTAAVDGTHDFQYAGTGISVSPTSGPLSGGGKLTITGSGFGSTTTVKVDGADCPKSGTPTATTVVCTLAAGSTAGPVSVVTTTGSVTSSISPTSVYSYLDQ